jgi:predicted MPP superfamily phosphohydrolase
MVKYVKMTFEEFEEIVEKQNAPNTLLQSTIDNYKKMLVSCTLKIDELEKELSVYVIGGARVSTVEEEEEEGETVDKTSIVRNRWSRNSIRQIKESVGSEISVTTLADILSRTEPSIRTKAISLGYRIKKGRIING